MVPRKGAVISGTVEYNDGSPAKNHEVSARLRDDTSDPAEIDGSTWGKVWDRLSSKTDDRGRYRLGGLPGGTYDVMADEDVKETVEVKFGRSAENINLRLKCGAPLRAETAVREASFRVFYPDGKPAPGATIYFIDEYGEFSYMDDAGETGSVTIKDEFTGSIGRFCAGMLGYGLSTIARVRLESPPEHTNLHLRREARISGTVTIPEGAIEGCKEFKVYANYWGAAGPGSVEGFQSAVGKGGKYEIPNLPPGTFKVFVDMADSGTDNINLETASLRAVTVSEGERKTVDIDLGSTGEIAVEIDLDEEELEESGEFENYSFAFWQGGAPFPPECPMPGSEITYAPEQQSLPPGNYVAAWMGVARGGLLWLTRSSVAVKAGTSAAVKLSYEARNFGSVTAKVLPRQGEAHPGLYGIFLKSDGASVLARPGASGSVEFAKVPAGRYKATLVWGTTWMVIRDLGTWTVKKGEATHLGDIAGE
jgi:hypothetical protein